jgi:uncharacterized metal-binding protein
MLADRVSPRSTIAEAIMLVTLNHSKVTFKEIVPLESSSWIDLLKILSDCKVDTIICGGIDRVSKKSLELQHHVSVIDNVACTAEEVIEALKSGSIGPGYGFNKKRISDHSEDTNPHSDEGKTTESTNVITVLESGGDAGASDLDCLSCPDRQCLRGELCSPAAAASLRESDHSTREMLEAAMDITSEKERTLCRLSELVYFCLEMDYKRIGLAYCVDLQEPVQILAGVLRRFFDVHPIGCKVGGVALTDTFSDYVRSEAAGESESIACNPLGQALILNRLNTDLNVIVGLCVGVDCIFSRESNAPVSTLFVKDKSLANNPIGAIYSEYYLKEAALASDMRA